MKLLLTTLYILAQYVDILADIIGLAIGTLGLDKAEIYTVGNRTSLVGAIPTAIDISPVKELHTPAIEDICMKLNNAAVVVFGLVYVVDTIAIGRKGIGHLKERGADRHVDGRNEFGLETYIITHPQLYARETRLPEFILGVLLITREKRGMLATLDKAPLITNLTAHTCGIGTEGYR